MLRLALISAAITTVAVLPGITAKCQAPPALIIQVESSPNNGLAWLATQQQDDGSWQINGRASPKATSLCLLAFLASGNTHADGEYKVNVNKGLKFLIGASKLESPKRARLGKVENHALAAMVLSETYAMTEDKQLVVPAQAAIDLLVRTQNNDGGWGSKPGEASTMRDMAWPVLALTSGRLADLAVSKEAFTGVARFLDQCQAEDGAFYGLTKPGQFPDTTSIGLLCRLLLGAEHDDPAIEKGLKYLAKTGPSESELRYNLFSTLALIGSRTDIFSAWNRQLREELLAAQVKAGDDKGSWPPVGRGFGKSEATAMNLLCVQVYYRHLPVYQELANGWVEDR